MVTGGTGTIGVLHVDDDREFADLTATALEREDDRFAVETAPDAGGALDRIEDRSPDCVVSDYDMPGRDGIEFLRAVRDRSPDLPFILFTGKGSEELASEAISAGVTDYLQKGSGTEQFELLANRITNAVSRHRARTNYRELFRKADVGLAIDDPESGTIVDANEAYAEIVGHDREEVIGRHPGELSPADSSQTGRDAQRLIDRAVEDGPQTFERHFGTETGEERLAAVTLAPIVLDGRERVLASVSDLTEREERERRFQAIVEESNDVISVVDADGRFQYQSPSLERVLGYSPAATVGDTAWEYIHPDDREAVRETFEEWLATSETTEPIEYRARHADGSWRWMEAHGNNQLDNPAVEGYVVNSRDVTARRERDQEVREIRSQYRTLVENFPDGGVFLFDEDLRYVRAGGEGLRDVGLSADDVEGRTPHDLFPDGIAEETADYYRTTLAGESCTYEQEYRGDRYRVRTIPIRAGGADAAYGVAVSRNVTDEVERERELERQNERLAEFAGIVSHDLRNPLTVAEGRLELARTECDSAHLDRAGDAIDRCQALVEDVLALARDGDTVGRPEPVPLGDLAAECWEAIPSDGATLRVESDRTVSADRSRLQRLFENLFSNAVEHGSTSPDSQTPEDAVEHGGRGVTVTVGDLADGFYVADDGVGIPDDAGMDVFEAGFSTDDGGTGFGLRIVERIVRAHGWEIRATDAEAGGARFEVTGVTFVERTRDSRTDDAVER
jgi:PAS domain S-box-containing protein